MAAPYDQTLGDSFMPLKILLPPVIIRIKLPDMSAVEIAVSKVKKMSAPEARELLAWLAARQPSGLALPPSSRQPRRKTTARQRMKKLMAWHDSVRGTTDWEPPRMPDDLVKVAPL